MNTIQHEFEEYLKANGLDSLPPETIAMVRGIYYNGAVGLMAIQIRVARLDRERREVPGPGVHIVSGLLDEIREFLEETNRTSNSPCLR